jgi:hypothetical protein
MTKSRQGRLIAVIFSRPCRDCPSSVWLTRQFLPGYFQPRLPALLPRHVKIDCAHFRCPREMSSAFCRQCLSRLFRRWDANLATDGMFTPR